VAHKLFWGKKKLCTPVLKYVAVLDRLIY